MPQNPRQVTCSNLFTPGRACAATAVVLHEWSSGIENLDHEMCRCLRPRPLTSPGCHTSFNFGIGGNCNFRQYVPLADTAWGFYFVPAPLCPIPPCPINQLCDGIGSDQYNPQENGTLPTPVVSAGPDLSANCSVIHVAIATGAARTGSGLFCIGSPNFSENAYRCLVESLCYIYETTGLVPNGYSNLLTHIGELMELDLDQLAIDIQACMDFVPAPPPPCDCAPSISATLGNLSTAVADGLYTSFTVTDTPTIDLIKTGTALSAAVKISSNAGNVVISLPDGLFAPTPAAPAQTPITVNDSATLDLTASGTDNHTLTGTVRVSATAGNQVSANVDGLFVPASTPTTLLDCSGGAVANNTSIITRANLASNTQFGGSLQSIIGMPAPFSVTACPIRLFASDASLTPNKNLNGFQDFGANALGAVLQFSNSFADPVLIATANTYNVQTQLYAVSKHILLIDSATPAGSIAITNPPTATYSYKKLIIKNTDTVARTVTFSILDGVNPGTVSIPANGFIRLVYVPAKTSWYTI